MAFLSPWQKKSAPRFLEGGVEEAERLFGGRLPALPAGELVEGDEVIFYIQHHPSLRGLAHGYLTSLFSELAPESTRQGLVLGAGQSVEREYGQLLQRTLSNALLHDRRSGLVNLFFLSHSREIAENAAKLAARNQGMAGTRFAIHPLLSGFLRSAWSAACREVEKQRPGQLHFVLGSPPRAPLVDAVIDDQLPLALTDIREIDFATLLTNNTRYRIPYEVFADIKDVLSQEIEERLGRGDPLLMVQVRRHLPSLDRESYLSPGQIVKILFNGPVRRFLLADSWRVGARLRGSRRLQTEVARGVDPLALLESFDELANAVQRFELVSRLREHIRLLPAVLSEDQLHEQFGQVRRYFFSESVEVTGNATDATVMFLDLRGFTQTSEGAVSERDLAHELYTVFDPFIEIINRFDGTVDKFLGDGMMVTFGALHNTPYGALNALRTAVLLQDKIRELRREGKTEFSMGVSVHHGRVVLAHFMGSSGGPDTTVIGRNVNVAGRLSSASKRESADPFLEDALEESLHRELEQPARSELFVDVDAKGGLTNRGIAISRETLSAIEKVVNLQYPKRENGMQEAEYFDASINRKIRLRYVGDAKFKGVRSSLPVYSVDYQ